MIQDCEDHECGPWAIKDVLMMIGMGICMIVLSFILWPLCKVKMFVVKEDE
jgi:hypothetical protein